MSSRLNLSLGCVLLFTGCLAISARAATPAGASLSFEKDVRPIIQSQCVSCHDAQKMKGDLDLSQFQTTAKAVAEDDVWTGVGERLRAGDMPPKKARSRPTSDQRKTILAWIDSHISTVQMDCSGNANGQTAKTMEGYVMSRRLTRAEYKNTVRDLTGVDLAVDDLLPADGAGGEGFDTDGNALFMSVISVEKYLQAADQVMRAAIPDANTSASSPSKSTSEKILIAYPGPSLGARDAAKQVITAFARRAFRRPVAESEVDRLLTMFDRGQAHGQSYEASVRLALKAALISPNFLFLAESQVNQEGIHPLGDYPIASRLSYFLWSTLPDEELFSLAAKGRLHDENVLRRQVQRMLKDPRSIALAENFAPQWLGINSLGGVGRPDSGRFPQFDHDLEIAERQEVILFFDSLIREDQSLLQLLDAHYTFANEKLAALYGLHDVHGSDMRRVDLPDRTRGGVLGMAAILTSTSYPLRTSPVLRGKWVMNQLLGEKIPPPPPDAGQLPPDDRQANGQTFRQRLEAHRVRPECATCHSRMDPLGFGLDNYDAIGRWRTQQGKQPIDSSGVLPDGTQFRGAQELKDVLMHRKSQFLYTLSRKLLGYGLGRGLNRYDECVIKDEVRALEGSDNEPSALVETIVLSKPFQFRYGSK